MLLTTDEFANTLIETSKTGCHIEGGSLQTRFIEWKYSYFDYIYRHLFTKHNW